MTTERAPGAPQGHPLRASDYYRDTQLVDEAPYGASTRRHRAARVTRFSRADKPSLPRIPSDRLGRSQIELIKTGGRLVRHARRLVFQLAEVAVPREVFRQVLERIGGLHPAPG